MRTTSHRWLALGLLVVVAGLLGLLGGLRRVAREERETVGAVSGPPALGGHSVGPLDARPDALDTSPEVSPSAVEPSRVAPTEPTSAGRIPLEVRVYDERLVPITGARVHASDEEATLARTTDADGRCILLVRASDDRVRLHAEAAGRLHSSYEYERDQPCEFQLVPAARVHGRVRAQGEPAGVTGARIRLAHATCDGCGPDEVVSGPEGVFELPEVPCLVPAVIAVEAEGFVPIERQEFLLPHAEPVVEQDLFLVRGLELRGRVLDWDTLEGLHGARVAGLVTDAEGSFHGRICVSPGTMTARASASSEGRATLSLPVDLGQGELELRLPRLVTLEGQIVDEGGAPLEGANLSVKGHGPEQREDGTVVESSPLYELPPGHSFSGADGHARTDARGRFRLSALPWSLNVELEAECRGYQSRPRLVPRLGEPGSTLSTSFTLAREPSDGTWLEGHVLLNGLPTDAAGVLSWQGPTRGGEWRFEHGRFELRVEPGQLSLRLRLDEVPEVLAGAELSTLARADEHNYCAVLLRVAAATISGRARFEDGAPLSHAHVYASCGEDLFVAERPTDERGEFTLDVADLGRPYAVHGSFLGQSQALEGIAVGSRDVELVFAQRYRALVRLVDATGTRLSPRAHVRLLARSDRQLFAPVESDEETPDLAGWHEVWVTQPRVDFLARPVHRDLQGYGSALVRGVELVRPDGRPPRVELVLRRMPPLVVELDRNAEPWPEDHELLLVEEDLLAEIRSKPGGLTSFLPLLASDRRLHFQARRAELAGLAPGRYRFVVWPADLVLDPPEVLVEAEPGLPVPLRWRPAR